MGGEIMYIRFEWRELTQDGRLVKIDPVEITDASDVIAGDGPYYAETLTGSFDSEDDAMAAALEYNKSWYRSRFPENLVLIKKVDL